MTDLSVSLDNDGFGIFWDYYLIKLRESHSTVDKVELVVIDRNQDSRKN